MPHGVIADPDYDLLKPREVAEMLGVRAATVGFWARTGVLKPFLRTPGGHRRFRRADVLAFGETAPDPGQQKMEEDAVRLYEQGWSIRRVAEEFGCGYGRMRGILLKHAVLIKR
jgi:excisionase family DNA binding protein